MGIFKFESDIENSSESYRDYVLYVGGKYVNWFRVKNLKTGKCSKRGSRIIGGRLNLTVLSQNLVLEFGMRQNFDNNFDLNGILQA